MPAFSSNLTRIASLHDDLDGTANSNEEDWQSRKTSGAIREDLPVVVPDVDYDIQAQSAMSSYGFIQGCVKRRNKGFEGVTLFSGT